LPILFQPIHNAAFANGIEQLNEVLIFLQRVLQD